MQIGVFGLVDDSHAATAQLFEDAVVGDDLVEHLWRGGAKVMVGRSTG
jgi:hypothetical protein